MKNSRPVRKQIRVSDHMVEALALWKKQCPQHSESDILHKAMGFYTRARLNAFNDEVAEICNNLEYID
jgi:hypothetical protein